MCISVSAKYATTGLLLIALAVRTDVPFGKSCEFDEDIIVNSTTISLFPTGENDFCYRLVASIRIDETTDVTHEQLYNSFHRLRNMRGTLEVVNTAFTNLSFFSSLFVLFSIRDAGFGYDFILMNNSKMETMAGGALLSVAVTQIHIENNPLLDPNCTHVLANYADNRRIRGNRFNCGCELDVPITNITINDVADNCSAIFGALYIFGPNVPSVEILMQKFGNANVVYGEIAVVSTNYEDLKFLKNVEKVEFYYLPQGPNALERFIRIENNVELQRLSWPKLMETTSASLRVAANPKLCVTISELRALLRTWIVRKVEVKVCHEVQPSESIEHVCRIGDTASLDTIPAHCQTFVGRLTIDHRSLNETLWKLYNVTTIFGNLIIRNSSLAGLSSLWKLKEIINLAVYESALVVESNVRLKSIFMKDLSRISSDLPVRIEDNRHLEMFSEECEKYQTYAQIDFRKNKLDCSALRMMSANIRGKYEFIPLFLSAFSTRLL
ncbi:hypothetical protein Aduo_007301 [Ancylostoma duodenale]